MEHFLKALRERGNRATIPVGSELAMKLLQNNIGNQSLRPQVVSQYTRDMKNDSWHTCYTPIIIGKNGVLVNGQHRLLSVCKSNTIQIFDFVLDESFDSARDYRGDEGIKRKSGYTLNLTEHQVAISRAAITIAHGAISPTKDEILKMWEKLEPMWKNTIQNFTTRRAVSQANVILGVIVRANTDKTFTYCGETFNAMLVDNPLKMSPYVWSFYKQLVIDNVKFNKYELFYLAYRAFDFEKKDFSKMQVRDTTLAYQSAQLALRKLIE